MKIPVAAMLITLLLSSSAAAIGPLVLHDADSTAAMRVQFAGQLLTSWESSGRNGDAGNKSDLFMKVRRARPSLRVNLPRYHTSFRLHLNVAPGAIELMDFHFDAKLTHQFQIRAGQFKIPFTRYRIQSFQRLTFVDWSMVTRYFGAERQLGLSFHNGYEQPPQFAYAIGVFSGVNARASHGTRLASLYGEEIINRSDLAGSSPQSSFHPELVGHVAFGSRAIDIRSDSDARGGPLRYSIASSLAWDLDPAEYQDLALRAAQEMLLKCRGLSLMTTVYMGFKAIDGSFRTRKAFSGILAQSAYRLHDLEVSLRYAYVEADRAVADDAHDRASSIIEDADDNKLVARYGDAGMLLAEHEGTLGINVYVDGHGLKLQNDVGFTKYERRHDDRTVYLIRSQIQLAF